MAPLCPAGRSRGESKRGTNTNGCFPLSKAVFSSVFYFASVPLYQGFLMVG